MGDLGLRLVLAALHRGEVLVADDVLGARTASALLADVKRQMANDGGFEVETVADPRLGYVRLHGRNAQAWFDPRAGRDDKYDYLYTPAEVEDWDQRIRALTGLTEKTVVIANNHFRGKAPANALELRKLAGDAVEVPRSLLRTYPRLADA